jgi:DNA topoisomerase-6 subunit B
VKQILAGLLKGVKAEFYTATTRPPAVYRGNPFQIEVGLAFGGDLPNEELARVIRFANRVPLLYQQSACCAFKAVAETNWRNYALQQGRGALPQAPMIALIHMASVWVPFTSESKEAIADYDEIRKEIRLAISECGRKLNTYLRRRQRIRREGERRGVFERYIGEVVQAMHVIDPNYDPADLRDRFEAVARKITEEADTVFDDDGNPITEAAKKKDNGNGSLDRDEATVIVESEAKAEVADDEDRAQSISRNASRRRKSADDDDEETLFGN